MLSSLLLTFVADLMINDGRSCIFAKYIAPFEIVNHYENESNSITDEIIDSIHSNTIHKNKDYELYNRIVSSDSTHLYGDFHIGMPMYKFMNISEDNHYESDYYYCDNSSKYELVDSLYFSLDGIFVERKLIGVKFKSDELESHEKVTGLYIEKLKKTLSKKYGLVHYEKTGNNYYKGAWRFDNKHIVISLRNRESYYTNNRIELYIYDPKTIREEIAERQYKAKLEEIQREKEREKELWRLEQEQKELLEIRKNDSISKEKRRKEQQDDF